MLLGPPASGKGTQADLIKATFGFVPASPGAMLREENSAGTPLGKEADLLTSQGKLVPDEVINSVVWAWLSRQQDDAFVFDGYPRTVGQADALDKMLIDRKTPLDAAFFLDVDAEILFQRVERRMGCANCGNIVSIGLHIPAGETKCPRCRAELTRRRDDTPETLQARLAEYEVKTAPLISYYENRNLLYRINASRTPELVFEDIQQILNS